MGDYNRFCPQTANMTFATLWQTYFPHTFNLTMHFSLRYLAAKMLSQIYNNFISFLYFFPSYETCSINVNPLFHAAIKNLHIKSNGIFFFVLLPSLIYLLLKLSEEVNKHTHAPYNFSSPKIITIYHLAKQVLLFNTQIILLNITLLNGSTYCYVSLTIQLSISHSFTHS